MQRSVGLDLRVNKEQSTKPEGTLPFKIDVLKNTIKITFTDPTCSIDTSEGPKGPNLEIKDALVGVVESSKHANIFIDMHIIKYADVSFLVTLLILQRKIEQRGGMLVLFGMNSAVLKVFQLSHLDTLFVIVENEGDAWSVLR